MIWRKTNKMTKEKAKEPQLRFKGFTNAWEQRKLENIFDIHTDFVSNGSFQALKENVAYYTEENYAYMIRLQDASNNWKGPWLYTNKHGYDFLKKSSLKPNDILMSDRGTIGKFFQVPELDRPMTLASNAVLLRSIKNDNTFLFNLMSTKNIQTQIVLRTTPGAQPMISKTEFKKITAQIPDKKEQEKIGQYFESLDHLITLHQRKCDLLSKAKKTLLQKMFPKNGETTPEIRFKGFTGAWEQRKLGELVDVRSGRDYKHLSEGDIPVYGTGGYMLSVDEALSYNEDAVGIGRKGTIDKPYVLKAPFWTVDTLFYAVPRDKYDLNFVFDIFQNIDWKKKDESTGVPSLSKTLINRIEILTPKYNEQEMIGKYFANLDRLITLHQHELEKLKNIKKSCLKMMFV